MSQTVSLINGRDENPFAVMKRTATGLAEHRSVLSAPNRPPITVKPCEMEAVVSAANKIFIFVKHAVKCRKKRRTLESRAEPESADEARTGDMAMREESEQ